MKVDELTIKVNAKLDVDRATANGCAKLLAIYLNNTCTSLKAEQNDDGSIELVIVDSGKKS